MKRTSLVTLLACLTALCLSASIAYSAKTERSQLRSLDEPSTALTINRVTDGLVLQWYPATGLNYWVVTYSRFADMSQLDTLAITSDTFYVYDDSDGLHPLGFFQVDPIDMVPPADTVIAIESFAFDPILLSIVGEDADPNSYEIIDTDHAGPDNYSLRLYGNTWKRITIQPYQIDSSTVWGIWAKLERRGEVQAIGVADSANYLYYIIWGKEAPQSQYWNTTYEGWFEEDEWTDVLLPIGEDWEGRFGYAPRITELRFVNDNDTVSQDGEVLFDDLRDVTDAQPLKPVAAFEWSSLTDSDPDSVHIAFRSHAYDLDSPWLDHLWDFGDGQTSTLYHPEHVFVSHSRHRVTLTVSDQETRESWITHAIEDTPVTAPRDMWFAFTGDIITGRGYENDNGIIESWGIDTLFEPSYPWLQTADLTSVNLECPLTTATTGHPTKGIVFKSNPSNVSGFVNAGIDFVTLANNHVFDYMVNGMLETMYVLDTAGIVHNGAGMNDELARRVRFLSSNGLSFAMLSFSDRTGSYNNVQPFLDSGRSRPGFAMWNRAAIESTVEEAAALSDYVVINTHSGDEYTLQPVLGMDQPDDPLGDEGMILELVPDTLQRQLRQYAIDLGAELVIAHHPHIIQGFEVYNGKLIAHSLGNFIFDLTYSETMPTVVLKTHFSADQGVDKAVVHPAYINHWIPQPAQGELARNILDYESEMSRRLGTWLLRAPGADSALIVFDTTGFLRSAQLQSYTLPLTQDGIWWVSVPQKLEMDGYPISAEVITGPDFQIRYGREKLYFGNMESEGADGWLLNSGDEGYVTDIAHSGSRSIRLRRTSGTPGNVVTNIEYRIPLPATQVYSIVGWQRNENAGTTSIQAQYYAQRSGGTALGLADIGGSSNGTTDWVLRSAPLVPPNGTTFISIRMSLLAPGTGTGYSWFDDISLVQWDNWMDQPATAGFPNDYHYVQVRSATNAGTVELQYWREWIETGQIALRGNRVQR